MQQTAPPTPRVHPQPMDGDPAPDLLGQIFRAISALKSAYARLQEAHTPHDPARVQAADRDVVRELVRLSELKRAYRASRPEPGPGPGSDPRLAAEVEEQLRLLRTYEVVVGRFRAQIRTRDAEVGLLRDRIRTAAEKKLALDAQLRRRDLLRTCDDPRVDFSSQEFKLGQVFGTCGTGRVGFSSQEFKVGQFSGTCDTRSVDFSSQEFKVGQLPDTGRVDFPSMEFMLGQLSGACDSRSVDFSSQEFKVGQVPGTCRTGPVDFPSMEFKVGEVLGTCPRSVDFSSQEFKLGQISGVDSSTEKLKLGQASGTCEEGVDLKSQELNPGQVSGTKLRSPRSGPQTAQVSEEDARPAPQAKPLNSVVTESERAELVAGAAELAYRAIHGFSKALVNMMKAAGWDLDAAAGAVEPGAVYSKRAHKKFAFEAFLCRKMFAGFEGGAVPEPDREDELLMEYQTMRSADAMEVLGQNPDSEFGKFCRERFLALVHPKMEGSFFGNLDQRGYVAKGGHPRTPFYQAFLKMAKSVWLLQRLALSLGSKFKVFRVEKGSGFEEICMQSVVPVEGEELGPRIRVGFMVMPGFVVAGRVVKSLVYLPGCRSSA
ncbi:uncharacterized protein LOC144710117 [Wolffia australiana]